MGYFMGRNILALYVIILIMIIIIPASAARLDPAFHSDGMNTDQGLTGGNESEDIEYAIINTNDDNIYIVGYSDNGSDNDIVIWLCDSFGNISQLAVFNHPTYNDDDYASGICFDHNGKLLVTGGTENNSSDLDMILLRYYPNGILDTSFNSTGYLTHNNAAGGNDKDEGRVVTVDQSNRIIVCGVSKGSGPSRMEDITIWCYTTNGTLDPGFNSGQGIVVLTNNGFDRPHDVIVDNNNKVIICGYYSHIGGSALITLRYNPDGTLDTGFNSTGYIIETDAPGDGDSNNDIAFGLSIDENNKILVAGQTGDGTTMVSDLIIFRYNPDGTRDTTFNGTGYVTHNPDSTKTSNVLANEVITDSFGRILVAGWSFSISPNGNEMPFGPAQPSIMTIWRFNQDGSLDTTFNNKGYVLAPDAAGGGGWNSGRDVLLDSQNRIIITGNSEGATTDDDLGVWCYTLIPLSPSNVTLVQPSLNRIDISWNDLSSETSYTLYRSLGVDPLFATKVNGTVQNSTNYADFPLPAYQTYNYWVKAFNEFGSSGFSQITSIYLEGPAYTPTGLNGTPLPPDQIDLCWKDVSNETSYTLYRSLIFDSGTAVPIAGFNQNVTNYSDTGLTPNNTYHYWVKAFNNYGSTGFSDPVIIYLEQCAKTPDNLSGNAVYPDQVDLSWKDVDNETCYTLFRSLSNNTNTAIKVVGLNQDITNYSDTGLSKHIPYYYWVRAYNSDGASRYSDVLSIMVPGEPDTPSWFNAYLDEFNSIKLEWVNVQYEDGYFIYRNNLYNSNTAQKCATFSADETAFVDKNLLVNTEYFYWIKAYNNYGESVFSKGIKIRTASDYSLDNVKIGPNPYSIGKNVELKFVQLPSDVTIKIYDLSGQLIKELNNPDNNGVIKWDTLGNSGIKIVNGLYFCHLETSDGERKIIRLAIAP